MAALSEECVEVLSCKIETDFKKERKLTATRDISAGEVILIESPLVSSQFLWNELYGYRACEMCLRSLETATQMARRLTGNTALELPYPACCPTRIEDHVRCPLCQAEYCSKRCRQVAWNTYHETLCVGLDAGHPLHKICDVWRNIHFPPETTSVTLIVKLIAMVKQSKEHQQLLEKIAVFRNKSVSDDANFAHKLLGEKFQDQLEVLRCLLSDWLRDDRIADWFSKDGFTNLFALVGTNGQGIGSSSLSSWAKECEKLSLSLEDKNELSLYLDQFYSDIDEVSGPFMDCEGSGLYVTQSACNHSCVPNAEIAFKHNDNRLSLVATDDISASSEIFISYLSDCDLSRSRHSRQKTLRENYLFTCDCSKCRLQCEESDVTSEDDMDDDDRCRNVFV